MGVHPPCQGSEGQAPDAPQEPPWSYLCVPGGILYYSQQKYCDRVSDAASSDLLSFSREHPHRAPEPPDWKPTRVVSARVTLGSDDGRPDG